MLRATRRYDSAPLGQVERTPQGGIKVPATLTRTGVFSYTQPDGSIRREYRPPAEVFAPESLATLRGAPVTNLHPGDGRVDAADWRRKAVGHAGDDARQDGDHVVATLYVQDADTIALIEGGTRSEVSLGYDQRLDETPGVSPEGERYDAVQREIRINHVALVPKGRAGSARLRLDADENQIPETTDPMKIKIAGKEYEAGSPEAVKALADLEARATRADAAEAEARALRCDALRTQASDLGVEVREDAATESEIMLEVLNKIAPGVAKEGASPDFVMGAFMAAISMSGMLGADDKPAEDAPAEEPEPVPPAGPSAASVRADAASVRAGVAAARAKRQAGAKARLDADDDDGPSPAEAARLKMIEDGKRRGAR